MDVKEEFISIDYRTNGIIVERTYYNLFERIKNLTDTGGRITGITVKRKYNEKK